MKRIILILTISLFCLYSSFAQTVVFEQCGSKSYFKLYNKDTVAITCDTAYILSKRAYHAYFKASGGALKDVKDIINTQMDHIEDCDKEVKRKTEDYAILKNKFDSLAATSISTSQSLSEDLKSVSTDLSSVKTTVTEAKAAISEASAYITKEKKNSFFKRLGWGLGGFAIGVVTAVLVSLN